MPQPRKYESRSAQQAAYRQRRLQSQHELLALKGLPSIPAIPTMPGLARWRAIAEQTRMLLRTAIDEMQTYYDDRSEQWKDGDNAHVLLNTIDQLEDAIDLIQV
jgi:hypothetical protein